MSAIPKLLSGSTDQEKLSELCTFPYKAQGVWFLNAFWDKHEGDAEDIWKYVHECEKVDVEKKEQGSGLDELHAHKFLENLGETLRVLELRNKLRETGAIAKTARPKLVPLTHYLLFKYGVDFTVLVNASQGDNSKEIAQAQAMLDEVSVAFADADAKAAAASAAFRAAASAEAEAKSTEAEAKAREADAKEREAPFKAAQEEVEAALADVKAQEDAYNQKKTDLETKSQAGGVSAMKAKNELAQLLGEDPLPLRRAKLTLEAARKKAEKARAPFDAATKEAVAARSAASAAAAEAEDRRKQSEAAKEASEAAVEECKKRVAEAEAYLEEVRNKPGCAYGALWYMDRELTEKKKYMPTSKGGIRA